MSIRMCSYYLRSFFGTDGILHTMYCIIMFLGSEIRTQEWQGYCSKNGGHKKFQKDMAQKVIAYGIHLDWSDVMDVKMRDSQTNLFVNVEQPLSNLSHQDGHTIHYTCSMLHDALVGGISPLLTRRKWSKIHKKGSTLRFWKRGEVIVTRNCNKESWSVLVL